MKAGWQIKNLGELCEVIAGQSPEGKFYNSEGNGIPFYQGKKDFGKKFIEPPTTWTTETTKLAREGDILMSVRAPVGPINFASNEICIGRGLAAIRCADNLDRDFLFYQLLHLQPAIAGREGAVFASINKAEIAALPLGYTPLPEQQRIVAILDEAFEGIATATANAELNLANAREVFQSYLQSVFSEKGEEWVALSELATDITDGDHMPPPKSPTGVPFITISNINKDTRCIDFSDTFTVSEEYFRKLKPNKKPLKGDVLYTVTGSFGIPVRVDQNVDFCFQRHIGLIRPSAETDSAWLYYLLLSPQVFRQASIGATGTAQKTVSLKVLRNIQVPRVPMVEQREVAAKLDKLSAETQRLESIYKQKLTALTELKKSILNQAFSGQL